MTDPIKRNDALLPCPFCGGEPTISASLVDQVPCENHSCPADVVSFDGFSTIEAAIAAWNTRALPTLTPNPVDDSKTANPVVNDPAAIPALQARIEELTEERNITRRLLGAATQMQTETQAKLEKAVETLETIVDNGGAGSYHLARTTLAELEGK